MKTRPPAPIGLVVAVGLLLGAVSGAGAVRASHRPSSPAARVAETSATSAQAAGPELVVPVATGAITIDGELEDPGWAGPLARTGAFLTTEGQPAHPYSDARFAYREGQLFAVLYAADEDLRATHAKHDDPLYVADAFELVLHTARGEFVIDVSAAGTITDARRDASRRLDFGWESHARVAVDRDGTMNDPSDQDEEWVVELAIPLEALGLMGAVGERIGLTVRRCDEVPKVGRVCGGWGAAPLAGTLVLGGADPP